MLDTAEVCSLEELADRCGGDRSYVARIIKLTGVAPDIIDLILAGSEPSGLSLAILTAGLPDRWDQQHELLGVVPRVG